jgi:hypothetical protein
MKSGKIISAVLIASSLIFGDSVKGQQQFIQVSPGDIKIESIELEVQKTPSFQAGDVTIKKVDRPREWLELELEFEAKARAPKDAVLGELTFRYYVGVVDVATKQPVVLTGDVTHINIIVGEKYNSAMYVPPSTMGKLTGNFRNVDKNAVLAYGVEVLYNAQMVGLWSNTGTGQKARFWDGKPVTPGVMSRETTPFGILWIDRYPEIKVK